MKNYMFLIHKKLILQKIWLKTQKSYKVHQFLLNYNYISQKKSKRKKQSLKNTQKQNSYV